MKEKILQFGTGNFLRGFVADFVQTLHDKKLFDGSSGRKFKMKSSKVLQKGVAWVRYERG